MTPSPPLTAWPGLPAQFQQAGWAVLDAENFSTCTGAPLKALQAWLPYWDALPPDQHLRDGGRYRRRRHGCFVVEAASVRAMPHRPHWQPVEYNALHGGIQRHFDPLPAALVADPGWAQVLQGLARVADAMRGPRPWYVEAHPFRIDASEGIGRPTPEGAHRDGVDLVAVVFIGRSNVKGGETRVFNARGPEGVRFTLSQPFSALLLDDERVIHETTPIQPMQPGQPSWRDTLVLTYRQGGFQGPDAA